MIGFGRRRPYRLVVLIGLTAALLEMGCLGLTPETSPLRYWLLSPVDGKPADVEARGSVAVGPVEFPDYLDRTEVVRRKGPHELSVSDFNRWGGSLEQGFKDILARNLEVLVPGATAVRFPWKGPQDVEYRLSMTVSRFETDISSSVAALDASWALTRLRGGEPLGSGRARIREPLEGEGYAASADAMSRALAALSREVAAALEAAL